MAQLQRYHPMGLALALLTASGCASDSAVTSEPVGRVETAATQEEPRHWLLVLHHTPSGWTVHERVLVDAPLPHRRNASRRARPLVVELRDAEGRTLYSDSLPDPSWVTGEFVDPETGEATHARVRPPDGAAVTVRVPILPTARALAMTLNGVPLEVSARGISFAPGELGTRGP